MPKTIAIVEDEAALAANYADACRRQGYQVNQYRSRPEAMAAFERRLPDLVIIDIGLGDEPDGGYELCKFLRGRSTQLPIIFLTALSEDVDKICGLRLDADDYLTKDISLPHLMARINALFRRLEARKPAIEEGTVIERGSLSINTDCFTVSWNGHPVDLTVTEFWIVEALARHPGHLKTRRQLMEAAHTVVDDNSITSTIKRIRKKISRVDPDADPIQTEYGMGYRWRS